MVLVGRSGVPVGGGQAGGHDAVRRTTAKYGLGVRRDLEQGVPKAASARRVGVAREAVYRWIETG